MASPTRWKIRASWLLAALLLGSSGAIAQCEDCGSVCRQRRKRRSNEEAAPARTKGPALPMGGLVGAPRSEISAGRLMVLWDSAVPAMERVLTFEGALAAVRRQDPRPLIVLRDCSDCSELDMMHMEKVFEDERTALAAKWFHCVKLDRRVVEETHSYHALFCRGRLPHLFVTTWDGATYVPIRSYAPWRSVQSTLLRILSLEYRTDPAAAIKRWLELLERFDKVAAQARRLNEQIGRALAKKRLDRSGRAKLARLRADLKKLERQERGIKKQEQRLARLGFRRTLKKKTQRDFDAEAAAAVSAHGGKTLIDRVEEGKKDRK